MHLFDIPQCSIQNRNMHISALNGALWDMEHVHSEISELVQWTCFHLNWFVEINSCKCILLALILMIKINFTVILPNIFVSEIISLLWTFLWFDFTVTYKYVQYTWYCYKPHNWIIWYLINRNDYNIWKYWHYHHDQNKYLFNKLFTIYFCWIKIKHPFVYLENGNFSPDNCLEL